MRWFKITNLKSQQSWSFEQLFYWEEIQTKFKSLYSEQSYPYSHVKYRTSLYNLMHVISILRWQKICVERYLTSRRSLISNDVGTKVFFQFMVWVYGPVVVSVVNIRVVHKVQYDQFHDMGTFFFKQH